MTIGLENKVGFCIGTGRCGTLFLYQLLELEPEVASSHERYPDNEAFHRYCKWHDLPVDDGGFLEIKKKEIEEDLVSKGFSFEASPYLSLSAKELHEHFGAKFVLLVRRPDRVVTSFVHKGFYRRPYYVSNNQLAAGFQDQSPEAGYTSFARISPRGDFFQAWNRMTQVGKVAWFWRAWNERTMALLEGLPPDAVRVIRIEDFDYPKYVEMAGFFGFHPQVGQQDFDTLNAKRPHAFWRKKNVDRWSDQEVQEFESQVGDLAKRFGYEYQIAELVQEALAERARAEELGHIPKQRNGPQFWRLRRATADWLRNVGKGLGNLANGIDVE